MWLACFPRPNGVRSVKFECVGRTTADPWLLHLMIIVLELRVCETLARGLVFAAWGWTVRAWCENVSLWPVGVDLTVWCLGSVGRAAEVAQEHRSVGRAAQSGSGTPPWEVSVRRPLILDHGNGSRVGSI